MQLTESYRFDSDVDTVLARFTDRDYFLHKQSSLGATDIEVIACSDDGDRFSITVRQRMAPVTPLPAFLQQRMGPRIAFTETDTWQRSGRCGRVEVTVHAAPIRIAVDMLLSAQPVGSRLQLDFDIRAAVPVIGRRIEQYVAATIAARMRNDLAERARLSTHRPP